MSLKERLSSGYSRTCWSRRSLAVVCVRHSFQCSDRTAVRLFTNIYRDLQRGRKLLGPIIEERLRSLNEYGNEWAGKPVGQSRSQTISALTIGFMIERFSIMVDGTGRGLRVDSKVLDNPYNGHECCGYPCRSRWHFSPRILVILRSFNFVFRRLPSYASISCCRPDSPDWCHMTELHSCALLPRSKSLLYPISSWGGWNNHWEGGIVESCDRQDAKSRQLPQGMPTSRRLI